MSGFVDTTLLQAIDMAANGRTVIILFGNSDSLHRGMHMTKSLLAAGPKL